MNVRGYDVEVQKLAPDLGGGFVPCVPALKGCVADGETREEALSDVEDALACWLEIASSEGSVGPSA